MYRLMALLCSFIWAGVTIATKILTPAVPALSFAFIRYALVALCLLPCFIIHKEYRQFRITDLSGIMFLGFSLVVVFNALFFTALSYTSASSVALIGAINPVFMMSIAALFSHFAPLRSQLVAFLLGFIGIALLVTCGHNGFSFFTGNTGEWLTLAAVVCQTIYAIALRKISANHSPLFITFGTALSGILFLVPLIANKEFSASVSELSTFDWGLFAFISFFGSTLAIFLYARALKHLGAARIGLLVFTTMPIFVTILAYCVLGETLTIWQLTGGALVLASLAMSLRKEN